MAPEDDESEVASAIESVVELATRGDFSRLDVITRALGHGERGIRLDAAYACKRIGFSSAFNELCRMALADSASENRAQAIYALGGIGRPSAIPTIAEALGDTENEVREAARTVLYRMMGLEVQPLLGDDGDELDPDEPKLVEQWWSIRSPSFEPERVYAIGRFASPEIFIARLEEAVGIVPGEYLDLLRDWTGVDFGSSPMPEVIVNWKEWWKRNRETYLDGRRYFHGWLVP
jgi:hypothetical protein